MTNLASVNENEIKTNIFFILFEIFMYEFRKNYPKSIFFLFHSKKVNKSVSIT